ncbi:hypothetical protein [Desulforhabdus sp. TSK]|uniref:hypothetical protein n=1 Tax=Desulforhabdus sp. TSK TaxID=2925014 RepID=UPI001FC82D45|nr:hypothetical protein [Desulforhabdus sp. TSK]GKT07328.1 hypothetical protein DSTSK_06330 [Desulforhabdus sp. TSK]
MPYENGSERHEDLLKRLLGVTRRIEAMLKGLGHEDVAFSVDFQKSKQSRTADVESLRALVEEHAILNKALAEAGLSEDPQILPLVKSVWEEVRTVVSRLESCRNHSLELMSLQERQKSCAAAYIHEANRRR